LGITQTVSAITTTSTVDCIGVRTKGHQAGFLTRVLPNKCTSFRKYNSSCQTFCYETNWQLLL